MLGEGPIPSRQDLVAASRNGQQGGNMLGGGHRGFYAQRSVGGLAQVKVPGFPFRSPANLHAVPT